MLKLNKLFLSFCAVCAIGLQGYAADYKIDEAHTAVSFKVKHLGISYTQGKFENVAGTFNFAPEQIKQSKANAIIKVSSLNTGIKQRDEHLKSPEFFDADKYPEITFVTQSVKPSGKDAYDIIGNLTIHGVTKPVVLKANYEGTVKDPWGNERAGFTASTKINRQDYGMNFNKTVDNGGLLVGDEVWISLEVEGIKEK